MKNKANTETSLKPSKKKSNTKISIKTKIIGTIVPVVTILIVVMILLSYTISGKIISNNATSLLDSSISYQSESIAGWLNENLAAFSTAKQTIEQTKASGAELQKLLDSYYEYNANYPNGLYVADEKGNVIKASKSEQTFHDVTQSTWYQEGLSRINMKYGSAYESDDGTNQVSASALLNDGSGTIRVISADVSLQRIAVIVNSFVKMNDAAAFLIDTNDGTILAHRDSSLVSTKLDTSNKDAFLSSVAKKISDNDYDTCELNGNLTGFETVSGTNWVLVSYIPDKIIYADVNSLRTKMVVIAVVALLVLVVLVERIIHLVVKPVRRLTKTITTMADGDFTVDVKVKGSDEIGHMGRSVRHFLDSIRGMLYEIHEISDRVSEQSDTTNNLSVGMYDSASVQAKSMQELNVTVDELSRSISEIADNATTLAMVVSDTKQTSTKVESHMQQTVTASIQGKNDMRQVNDAMETISSSIRKLDQAIDKVGKSSEEIEKIVGVIGNIADETNLLSLNASIEAARAGEAGKGFAVVATEIGKLAQTSTESVGHIVELINEVTGLVQETIKQAADSMKNIDDSSLMINTALRTFDEIFNDIQVTEDLIKQMMTKVSEVDSVATNVAAISEEQAASTLEIQATSENMVAQANSIADNSNIVMDGAKELSQSADNLKEHIGRFKI
ncbi:putative methyl-accepting chemotaxis protein signaling domain protein [Roseburia sp. CAG:380]|nr:putative methyl-accepting chemotaxis protein signaling domain protein [Roseburia sp. CAG:380]